MTSASGVDRDAGPTLSAIVPTLGLSPWLRSCLEALRRDGGKELEIVLVAQGAVDVAGAQEIADRVVRTPSNLGFAAANNLGIAAAHGEYLATVNDDAILSEGWCGALLEALEKRPDAAAAQGINVQLDEPAKVDGAGLAWNRGWQAVQIGHGGLSDHIDAGGRQSAVEIFGVSATAAIYRRSALAEASGAAQAGADLTGSSLNVFDRRLFAYYEDVDLACRLRGHGFKALRVPAATAQHAGSLTGEQMTGGKVRWIYRNRQLVLARLLGRAFWPRWPRILLRDMVDFWSAARRRDRTTAAGIVAGLSATARHWPGFARMGRPLVSLAELRRFQVGTP